MTREMDFIRKLIYFRLNTYPVIICIKILKLFNEI